MIVGLIFLDYKEKIGFKGQFLIEPKPKEPTKHQYDYGELTYIEVGDVSGVTSISFKKFSDRLASVFEFQVKSKPSHRANLPIQC